MSMMPQTPGEFHPAKSGGMQLASKHDASNSKGCPLAKSGGMQRWRLAEYCAAQSTMRSLLDMHYSLKRQPQRNLRMGVLMQLQQKL